MNTSIHFQHESLCSFHNEWVFSQDCGENQDTRFMFEHFFSKVASENTIEADRPQVTIWHIRIAFRIPKTTNTRSEYVTLIVFPLQQWSSERASMLTLYVRCLSGSVQWDSQTYMCSHQMSESFTVTAQLKEL